MSNLGIWQSYRLRLRRRRWRLRAFRKSRELRNVVNRTDQIKPNDVLLFCTLRNENIRLEYFLKYYRSIGVDHFFFVDNDSDDGSVQYLAGQKDASVWSTPASYKSARFGADWLNYLQMKYAHDHWILVVDVDEFFIYPFCDTRPLHALTDWLDATDVRSFGAMLLDMYPKGPIETYNYTSGDNPLEIANWFDSGNYTYKKNKLLGNLWIQGGPRARAFFPDTPIDAPALNKIPLIKWRRDYTFDSSTHTVLPRGLNLVYEQSGGEKASGMLLHTKFLNTFADKAAQEVQRNQHYAGSREYSAYVNGMSDDLDLWCNWSERYINWRQLEVLGLMSKGHWA